MFVNLRPVSTRMLIWFDSMYFAVFSSAFSRIRIEYGEVLRISRYSVQMLENMDQNKYFLSGWLNEIFHFTIQEIAIIWS